MRTMKRLLALGAALAAMAVFAAPASAGPPPPQASCSGFVSSEEATSGEITGGVIGDTVHEIGHEAFAAFSQELAHTHGPDCFG
jgi:hypothetical protein